jgi:fructokinase
MTYHVSSIGELLVDMIPRSFGKYHESILFEAHLGGSPFNYATILSRFKVDVSGFGAVGSDELGKMLVEFMKDNKVRTETIRFKNARTSIAFVILSENGERSFFFYREPWTRTADTLFSIEDINEEVLLSSEVLYVSGMALSVPPLRDAVLYAMKLAGENGIKVFFDYNVRADVWKSREEMKRIYNEALRLSDVISISIDELEEFYGVKEYERVAQKILREFKAEIVCVKLGEKGSFIVEKDRSIQADAFKVKAVDATGAGDSWNATFTFYHLLSGEDLKSSVIFANAMGALTVSSRGAVGRKIKKEELEDFISSSEIPEVRVL